MRANQNHVNENRPLVPSVGRPPDSKPGRVTRYRRPPCAGELTPTRGTRTPSCCGSLSHSPGPSWALLVPGLLRCHPRRWLQTGYGYRPVAATVPNEPNELSVLGQARGTADSLSLCISLCLGQTLSAILPLLTRRRQKKSGLMLRAKEGTKSFKNEYKVSEPK